MDDVVGEVLIAAGNENLGAAHAIGAVRLFHRPGFHQAQIGAQPGSVSTWCRPIRPKPSWARYFSSSVNAGGDQRAIGPRRQHGIHRQRLVGAHPISLAAMVIKSGNPRAKFGRRAKAAPTRLAIGLVGFLEALGRAHRAVFEMAASASPDWLSGCSTSSQNLPALVRMSSIRSGDRSSNRGRSRLLCLQQLVDQKAEILDRRAIDRHGMSSQRFVFLRPDTIKEHEKTAGCWRIRRSLPPSGSRKGLRRDSRGILTAPRRRPSRWPTCLPILLVQVLGGLRLSRVFPGRSGADRRPTLRVVLAVALLAILVVSEELALPFTGHSGRRAGRAIDAGIGRALLLTVLEAFPPPCRIVFRRIHALVVVFIAELLRCPPRRWPERC